MDMLQKLLPIFLKEADINLELLRHFLQNQESSTSGQNDLEEAFRAAHTLKGTSRLVRAEAINSISRRLEAMLEKHFTAETHPTRVEFEAMQLAVEWLSQLVAALRDGQSEPKSLVADALLALELAGHFPGTTPLAELLDSDTDQRSALVDDPFVGDPEPQVDAADLIRAVQDPFAEDPDFGLGLDITSVERSMSISVAAELDSGEEIADPFAEDIRFDTALPQADKGTDAEEGLPADLPYDLFSEDQSYFDLPVSGSSEESDLSPVADSFAALADSQPEPEISLPVVDPFAEDPAVETEIDSPAAVTTAPSQPELQQLDRAKLVAESLLLPQSDEQPRRNYICCAFELCGNSYYLPLKYMVEIAEQPSLLPLPLAPTVVKGLINLRGQVMPVIDLSVLHPTRQPSNQVQRLVVTELKGEKLAFLADGVPYLSEVFVGEKIDLPEFVSQHRISGVET